MPRLPILTLSLLLAPANTVAANDPTPRSERTLNGPWEFRRDDVPADAWKSVNLPSVFQEHEGNDWHGVGWYRKTIDAIKLPPGRRMLLHFDAAATHAEVWWNNTRLGEHLGGWTPFRFDVTELIQGKPDGPHTIRVRLDERVGHNTQGFLPIIQPHYGGLWQHVKLIETPVRDIDELRMLAIGDPKSGEMTIEAPTIGVKDENLIYLVRYRLVGTENWRAADDQKIDVGGAIGLFHHRFKVTDYKLWSPEEPNLYEIELSSTVQRFVVRAAFRSIETKGTKLLLNDRPLVVRGVLNWGYYPPRLAPMPDRERWRRDIKLVKSMGFNLMKCCLWVPPREFFDLCDEEGMLVWQEYPTWHPKLDQAHKSDLVREYTEFFAHDRNHPSVILRSLTCETGASADLSVIRELYDLAKKQVPGCVVEDDSSWIEWNRISDVFDDHPYGNNHTWVATLKRLRDYAEKHGPKPLLLGEAIAADTWVDPTPLLKKVGNERPYWLPGFLDGNKKWLERMRSLYGEGGLERLGADSVHYAFLMRRFQIETFRREVPDGGYVVSALRDFPLAGMGLIGHDDKPKWSSGDWHWQSDSPELLKTANDARSFFGGQPLRAEIAANSKTESLDDDLPVVKDPRRRTIGVERTGWSIWVVPPPEPLPSGIIRAQRLDLDLLAKLENGGKVLLLPNSEKGSFPLNPHWFLRGGPYLPDHPLWTTVPRDMIVHLQHCDLAGDVIPDLQYLDEIDPVVLLWDNHDIKEVKTHGLVFETAVGKGRLFVSTLRHTGDANAAGKWLLGEFARHLATSPPPKRALKPETIRRMREKLQEKKLDLTKETWRFKPDPKNIGLAENWHKPELKLDNSWSTIRVGKHWEAQGWPNLDGWAWYRLDVPIPKDWAGQEVYLSFEGVDDHYEAFVTGAKIGSGGDPVAKRTAFDERASHKITAVIKPGETCSIAVRVLDWYGAGGIHRPVTLGTAQLGPGGDILR